MEKVMKASQLVALIMPYAIQQGHKERREVKNEAS